MYRVSRKWARAVFPLFLTLPAYFLLNVPQPLSAQTLISGDISGTVTDPSGAVVPNAHVTVTSVETGQSKAATSDAGGAYRVSLLTPGHYKVSVTASGFETATLTVSVSPGVVVPANVQLTVGQASTTVQVVGS
ncbi:MAG TPA: carboxypeptidase-like regulatory domain-containing protein, partial [Acidobacteriaceae bacterium]|nr:carboxypeptidase-like regulatory domain-containing protein [Acidobacteriaceae bacterium]